jgi:hypothetical protein
VLRSQECSGLDHTIDDILRSDSALAFEWLCRYVSQPEPSRHIVYQSTETVASDLTAEQRRELLGHIPEKFPDHSLIRTLYGHDPELYGALLQERRLFRMHLAPLAGLPSEGWTTLALLALEAGYTPEDVARATESGGREWVNEESEMRKEWMAAFELLTQHSDPRVRSIGEKGLRSERHEYERALREERNEAVFGWG